MDSPDPRMSAQTLKVLVELLSAPRRELSGSEVSASTKIASGTLYPILFRLEKAGWLESRWESEEPVSLGRPRRRYYKVTALGAVKARNLLADIHPAMGRLAWT
ncbi:helix-turn-helix transcriptional regulator [Mesorhizobium australicum]|uniref:PadR family transcriptional regulator n=1 Tax=Mesorhizobium australicum TaxID=536018 RepID=UPI000A1CCEF1